MIMSIFEVIKLGQKYLKLWPERRELANYFDEYRAIQVTRFVCRTLPFIALFVFIIQLYLGSLAVLPQALMYAIFMLSLPIQALIMLGVKADKYLPPSLASWYKQGVAKANEQGGKISLSIHKPRYLDLASLLDITYRKSVMK